MAETPVIDRETYTILGRAGDDLQKQGELVDWHLKRIREAETTAAVRIAAIDSEIAELEQALTAAKLAKTQVEERLERDIAWDAAQVSTWYRDAPQHAHQKAKSMKLSRGCVVGSRTLKPLLTIVDPQPLMTAMPDCCEMKLKEGEAKKRLAIATNGRIIYADTGELVPEGCVEVEREEQERYYLKSGETEHIIQQFGEFGDETEEDDD